MDDGLLERIAALVASGDLLVSSHGDTELAADSLGNTRSRGWAPAS